MPHHPSAVVVEDMLDQDFPIRIKTLGFDDIYIALGKEIENVQDIRNTFAAHVPWGRTDFRLIQNGMELTDETPIGDLLYMHEFILAKNTAMVLYALLRTDVRTPLFMNIRAVTAQPSRVVQGHSGMTVRQLKVALHRKKIHPNPPIQQLIILSGRKMKDSDMLGEYLTGLTHETATKALILDHVPPRTSLSVEILLVGGGHISTTVSIHDRVGKIKQILIGTGVYAPFRNQLTLYDSITRRELKDTSPIRKYDLGTTPKLYAVPTLSAFSASISGSTRPGLMLAQQVLPSPIDIFFPPQKTDFMESRRGFGGAMGSNTTATVASRRKLQSSLFTSLRRGFFDGSESLKDRTKLKVKRVDNSLKTRRFVLANAHTGRGSTELTSTAPSMAVYAKRRKKRIGENSENNSAKANAVAPATPDPASSSRKTLIQRCSICDRKLPLGMEIAGKCRCGQVLCALHIHSSSHVCSYNFKEKEKHDLERLNQRITSVKVSRI